MEKSYLVTSELETKPWQKVLRFFRVLPKRVDFHVVLFNSNYKVGDLIYNGVTKLKVLRCI
jgi:hypothetical protein